MQLGFQLRACGGDLREQFFVFRQQVVYVSRPSVDLVRVLEVEVVVPGFDLVDGHAPRLFVLLAFLPPGFLRLEFLNADRFAFVVALGARRIRMLVVPHLGGGLTFGEEKQVGANASVRIEDAVGQANDSVKITISE